MLSDYPAENLYETIVGFHDTAARFEVFKKAVEEDVVKRLASVKDEVDFGDSIRFGASTALEGEKDLTKVSCSMELFEAYTKGFIEECEGKLTDKEIKLLPLGAKVMTYECGMRILTDYLQGDKYFRTAYPEHNLDRYRTQFKLVQDMENKWDEMNTIVHKYM